MKRISISSILLFALVVPFIMTYRLSPGDTPYWLFGLIFLELFLFILLDLLNLSEKLYYNLKQLLLWTIIGLVIGSAFVSAIIVRHQTAPIYMIHDIILQQESAIRFFLDGRNPYEVTYFGTPLENWYYSPTEVNPALYHFVMEPFYMLFALPFYVASNMFFGYFDGRMPLLFLFFVLLILAASLVKEKAKRLLFVLLLAFNPAILGYTLEGRSDTFMFALLFAGLVLLHKKRFLLAGILIAAAFAIKQSAWPLLPFYLAFLYFKKGSIVETSKASLSFVITLISLILPFYLWNQKAFLDSTILYVSGNTPHSYPVSGYGFSMLLTQLGVIKDVNQYYPFHLAQFLIGLPIFVILTRFLKQKPNVSRLLLVYGLFLFAFWYFSRYFNNSHVAYLSMLFITVYFFPIDDEEEVEKAKA